MAVFKIIESTQAKVYVWKVEETSDELFAGLSFRVATEERLSKMKSEVHKKGFLAVRHLLGIAGYSDLDLRYDENGKPYLIDGHHISISHSFEYACIIISKNIVGIDIEQKRDKIQRIANKFLSQSEILMNEDLNTTQSIAYLTKVWCAKEVLFKMGDSRSLSFKDNMNVFLDSYNSISAKASIESTLFNLEVSIAIVDLDNFILAYAVAL